jgi:two-component system, OmpR family, response regulator MprA
MSGANGDDGRPRVLVVDDEPPMRTALTRALELGGFGVDLAANGDEGLSRASDGGPDLIVLDIMMPRLDGIGVCRRLRERGDRTPVLMLTARDAVADRVEGLEAGADDYLVKPFALEELLARIRALLRRTGTTEDEEPLSFADLTLDPVGRQVRRGERELELTRTEYMLLELLLRNPGRVLTREVIFDRVWGYDFGPRSKALDVYIGYLRRKTEACGEARLIHTVRGFGYVLRER